MREEVLLATLKKFLPTELVKVVNKKKPEDVSAGSAETSESAPVQPVSVAENGKRQSPLSDFLDTATGLAYCMNDEKFYREMQEEYVKGDKTKELAELFDKEDFENYRIAVHALKSSSLTIGATKVSEAAKALELACKENNLEFVKQNHGAFVEKYSALLVALKNS
jgi:HPt (histidine-containing phosphotransfer) domain-containing protein